MSKKITAELYLKICGGEPVEVWTAKMASLATGLTMDVIRSLRARRRVGTYELPGVILYKADDVMRYAENKGRGNPELVDPVKVGGA